MAETVAPSFPRPLLAPEAPRGHAMHFAASEPLPLDCGRMLAPFTLAYMTYGKLNADRSNVILVCHALSGDQFVTGIHPVTGRRGWWDLMVGPGLAIDTERYFVICPNVIGGCMGSTGPTDPDPAMGEALAGGFPVITVGDMVRAEAMLLDALGIREILCVTGGSLGGMQALEWLARFPERVISALPIATAARHTAQNIALHEVGRRAIMGDPDWRGGNYQRAGVVPKQGLSIARMVGHISYLSEAALERKFGRALQDGRHLAFGFAPEFQVESYLHHQGTSFVERFDANSYLTITRAMDYFDLAAAHCGDLAKAFAGVRACVRLHSFTGDWLFPTSENKAIAEALRAAGAEAELREIVSDKGHDAFLLDEPELFASVREFLDSVSAERGVEWEPPTRSGEAFASPERPPHKGEVNFSGQPLSAAPKSFSA